ncbi:MAG: tRNA 4-thiouridine(8) synthase ThiI [Treponema sp.]|nr:tRNA 4-thiouridine(8) synthase ThiI [Treponema sp.]
MTTYLLKPGELTLKSGNRQDFESVLRRNLAAMLRGTGAMLSMTQGRFYVRCAPENETGTEDVLRRLFGISGWAKTRVCEKQMDSIIDACIEEAAILFKKGIKTFKINARRTDKSFPADSYKISCTAGDAICGRIAGLAVDVKKPQGTISVEIREKAYIYADAREGLRGLPCGTAGRGMLLLSGGIDSPVAGFMMASRGMRLDAVYFHAWPFTPDEAKSKTIKLAEIIGSYSMGIRLSIINFTPVQNRIKERAPQSWRTVLLRMAMMDCAGILAQQRGDKCLISGESLSQVASQTIENITCTQSRVSLPVMRPLIGMDKEQIIRMAEKIGTYNTSILPYPDCCILFSPPHPVIRGNIAEAQQYYDSLEADELILTALREAETVKAGFPAQ